MKHSNNQGIIWIWIRTINWARSYWGWLLIAIIATAAFNLSDVWQVRIIKELVDYLTKGNMQNSQIIILALQFALLALIVQIGASLQYFCVEKVQSGYSNSVRKRILSKSIDTSHDQFSKYQQGDWITRFQSDIEGSSQLVGWRVIAILSNSVYAISTFALMINMNWLLACIDLIFPIFVLFLASKTGKPLELLTNFMQNKLSSVSNLFMDILRMNKLTKVFDQLKVYLLQKGHEHLNEYHTLRVKKARINATIFGVRGFTGAIPELVNVFVGGWLVLSGDLTIGELTAFIMLYNNLLTPLVSIGSQMSMISEGAACAKRLNEILALPESKPPVQVTSRQIDRLRLENICLKREGFELKNVCFDLAKGERLFIIGKSGAGKSTLLSILAGLTTDIKGKIYINNELVENVLELRNYVSYVEQDATFFDGTIAENIGLGTIDMDRIIDAAKAVNAHHFICQLPDGYNTVLDRNGSNLSGGQKQRIALARALFTDRPIILMDEPTANLDQKTEHMIIKDTEKAFSDKILIIVVHDYSWIRPFDKVLFMHEGYILENATDSELRSKYGDYYRMLELTLNCSWSSKH